MSLKILVSIVLALGITIIQTTQALATEETRTFRSIGQNDGWVLESKYNSRKGGTYSAKGPITYVGDGTNNGQYRSIFDFDTSSIPDGATIEAISVYFPYMASSYIETALRRNARPLGNVYIDIKTGHFGTSTALEAMDFQAAGEVGTSVWGDVGAWGLVDGWWYESGNLKSLGATLPNHTNKAINKKGHTQLRLRPENKSNLNKKAEYYQIVTATSSDENPDAPGLIVTYSY